MKSLRTFPRPYLVPAVTNPGIRSRSRGAALLIVLLMFSLMTIIVLGLMAAMTWEMTSSRSDFETQRAQSIATLGMNTAVAQLRGALDTWDNPYANFASTSPAFFWTISPGVLTRWSYTNAAPLTNCPLFSIGSTNLFNLNAAKGDGSYPIIGGANPPDVSVYWVNVLRNPAISTTNSANPIIGRYAFWVDDESAKININTADGTRKYQPSSLGVGSPSEVSLQALSQGGSSLSMTTASNIVYLARLSGFNSPREILRSSGVTSDLYTNNVFNLTAYSRSPDLNIFGQPRMCLTPALGGTTFADNDMRLNSVTLQPEREIYPTPSQLPPYHPTYPIDAITSPTWYPIVSETAAEPWPLQFRGADMVHSSGIHLQVGPYNQNQLIRTGNNPWINGWMLSQYLAGTNAAGNHIDWPPFTGSSSAGFLGKYNPRQIDSIVAQVTSLGSKLISPDVYDAESDGFDQTGSYMGLRSVVPFIFRGWLSYQWVNGMGRTPKVDALEITCTTQGAITNTAPPTPPEIIMNAKQEWWLPAAYLGGTNNTVTASWPGEGAVTFGAAGNRGMLNQYDTSIFPATPAASLPRADNVTLNYWANQLLTNNQGIDFQGNAPDQQDPDQADAALYHPYLLTNGIYMGSGPLAGINVPVLSVVNLENNPISQDWPPGQMHCIASRSADDSFDMQTNAGTPGNPALVVSGGIQTQTEFDNTFLSDFDPTPLETIGPYGGDQWTDPVSPGDTTHTFRQRFVKEVVPVNFSVSVPPPGDGSAPGPTVYLLATTTDPLVNKFPGDWQTTVTTNSESAVPAYWAGANNAAQQQNAAATNGDEFSTGFHGRLTDPDSYWLPQMDVSVAFLSQVPLQTLIPRSARFPNIGYLQYVRTGIIPDNDAIATPSDWPNEHGTPFRLLSFAPSTDTANQKTTLPSSQPYPDWAMLDLLYVPSFLAAYGSPYGYYQVDNTWTGNGDPNVLAANSTRGGSTPGRINPNGMLIYTTNANVPRPDVTRTIPMQAVLQNLIVNQQLASTSTMSTAAYTGGTPVDAPTIAMAIANYMRTNGPSGASVPLRMPAELCNVPEIAALRPSVNATRNDLIRQIMGTLTTQSNTFSVWVAGQSIQKSKSNLNYGIYEPGDQVLATVRTHYVIERYLDPGADGVYGNATQSLADSTNGTYSDPVDAVNHPFCPRYLYRVVLAEEIR